MITAEQALARAVDQDAEDDDEYAARLARKLRDRAANRANRIRLLAALRLCNAAGHQQQPPLFGPCPDCRTATNDLEVPS